MPPRLFRLSEPSPSEVAAFLAEQRDGAFSYPEVGASAGDFPRGYDHDRNEVRLGSGRKVFEAGRAALQRWEMFPGTWARIAPVGASVEVGTVVAMVARVWGAWWLNTTRIVYVETTPRAGERERWGFAYGTLAAHVECGEECFSVVWREDDSVVYQLKAFSHPRHVLVRLARPVARRMQRRFVRESLARMVALTR